MRLGKSTLSGLDPSVACFGYDRSAQGVGIVHFGIGAFHRAHQAWYTDTAMNAGEQNWMITGVSLRSGDVADQLNPQDGLYTLSECSAAGCKSRVIGSVANVLIASREADAVVAALAAPETHIASFTITEKGYCRAANGSLDMAQASEGSIYRFLAQGLRQRRDAGLPGLALLSCDNLAENGQQLDRLMREYLAQQDPALLDWYAEYCTCPQTMIDRIVPATTKQDRSAVASANGLTDLGAVMTEPFSQWVIEDRFAGPRPQWEKYGANLVADVAPFETAKLRMLNGAHSLLTYCGLQHGYTYVHEAIADPHLRALVDQLMLQEAAPTITPAAGQNLSAYATSLVERFANPALNHRLIQIAMDGSQKIPQRWLETLAANRVLGRECPAILSGLSAWLTHISGVNGPVDDPLADHFAKLWEKASRADFAEALFGNRGLLGGDWNLDEAERASIAA